MFYVHVTRKSDQFILQYNCLAYIIEINFYSKPRTETLKIIQINSSYERIKYAPVAPVTGPLHFIHSITVSFA
jgi:hypothetical protein